MKPQRALPSLIALFVASLSPVFASPAYAAKPEIYTKRLSTLAVDGYDPVAYFTDGAPTKGSKNFETTYKGAAFRFVSQENLDRFIANPAAYAPQYGGYCAWAAAQGYTARGNPQFWSVRDGKLYLNFNAKVQKDWLIDPDGFIRQADANWPGILD